jgi:hypothetical protein
VLKPQESATKCSAKQYTAVGHKRRRGEKKRREEEDYRAKINTRYPPTKT